MAAEITREKLFEQLHQELPYSLTVETESWTASADGTEIRIDQTIYVQRASQKAIVLGKGGRQIKAVGQAARARARADPGVPRPPVPVRQGAREVDRRIPSATASSGSSSPAERCWWQDEGVVLAVRRHGESSAVVSLLTRAHGRHAGLVRGGAGRGRARSTSPATGCRSTWRARLAEQLGSFTGELAERERGPAARPPRPPGGARLGLRAARGRPARARSSSPPV